MARWSAMTAPFVPGVELNAGFYRDWKAKYGEEARGVLEAAARTLS